MARRPNPYLTDEDNPELSGKELAAMRPAAELLPAGVYERLVAGEPVKRKPGQRGPGKKPAKVALTIRVDPETLAAFKATGSGWQGRVNAVLREALIAPSLEQNEPTKTVRRRA